MIQQAQFDAEEWRKHNGDINIGLSRSSSRMQTQDQAWKRPRVGYYKCNFDGSFMNATSLSKAGWGVRDERGTFRFAGQALGNRISMQWKRNFKLLS